MSYKYQVVEGWGLGPQGRELGGVVTGVAVDSQDRVYVSRRKPAAMLVYDREGRFLTSWGQDILENPHFLWMSRDDHIYCADSDNHTIRKFTTAGELVETWGTPGRPGSSGMPFNKPTKAMRSPAGELYVSDGYGQCRVHCFSQDGELSHAWGEEGQGPGQFALPHSLCVDRLGRVLVADRENNRIQIFDAQGTFLEEWTDVEMPMDLFIDSEDTLFVSEVPRRISIFTLEGELLARWGEQGDAPGQFPDAPHGICVDSRGDLYVTEVHETHARMQKFARV
jgi:DNA-binding beta-propeller fold protein YncE